MSVWPVWPAGQSREQDVVVDERPRDVRHDVDRRPAGSSRQTTIQAIGRPSWAPGRSQAAAGGGEPAAAGARPARRGRAAGRAARTRAAPRRRTRARRRARATDRPWRARRRSSSGRRPSRGTSARTAVGVGRRSERVPIATRASDRQAAEGDRRRRSRTGSRRATSAIGWRTFATTAATVRRDHDRDERQVAEPGPGRDVDREVAEDRRHRDSAGDREQPAEGAPDEDEEADPDRSRTGRPTSRPARGRGTPRSAASRSRTHRDGARRPVQSAANSV